jgi:DNA-binding NtrC family response regulator
MLKILVHIIDDEEAILDYLKYEFEQEADYTVKYFDNSTDFYGNFNKDVDLLITDVKLPQYDILDALKFVSEKNPACYIIVMSAFLSVDLLKEMIKYRVDGVVEKSSSNWVAELRHEIDRLKPKLIQKTSLRQ